MKNPIRIDFENNRLTNGKKGVTMMHPLPFKFGPAPGVVPSPSIELTRQGQLIECFYYHSGDIRAAYWVES